MPPDHSMPPARAREVRCGRALGIAVCLALANMLNGQGGSVRDPAENARAGLADTRFAEETLNAFRDAYARMGRPRISVAISQSKTTTLDARRVGDGGSRDLERAITRVLRLGGATLADERASLAPRENGLTVDVVQRLEEDGVSIMLTASLGSRTVVASGASGWVQAEAGEPPSSLVARAAEAATLDLLRSLSAKADR